LQLPFEGFDSGLGDRRINLRLGFDDIGLRVNPSGLGLECRLNKRGTCESKTWRVPLICSLIACTWP
jgi:hypothetical protein